MKKILALLLCICMLTAAFALMSCDTDSGKKKDKDGKELDVGDTIEELNGKTPEEIYDAALQSLEGIDNFKMVSSQDIKMQYNGQTQNMEQSIISMKDGQNEYVKMNNTSVSSMNMECWYVDEVYYAKASTGNFKAAISYDEYIEKYTPDGSTSEGALLYIPESWFVDVEFVYDGEDVYYIEFLVSADEFIDFFDKLGLTNLASIEAIEDISYKVYFDEDGNLGDIITEFSMEIEGIVAEYYLVNKVSDIGEVEITLPDGAENWTDKTGIL